jgi:hypothetical protein
MWPQCAILVYVFNLRQDSAHLRLHTPARLQNACAACMHHFAPMMNRKDVRAGRHAQCGASNPVLHDHTKGEAEEPTSATRCILVLQHLNLAPAGIGKFDARVVRPAAMQHRLESTQNHCSNPS